MSAKVEGKTVWEAWAWARVEVVEESEATARGPLSAQPTRRPGGWALHGREPGAARTERGKVPGRGQRRQREALGESPPCSRANSPPMMRAAYLHDCPPPRARLPHALPVWGTICTLLWSNGASMGPLPETRPAPPIHQNTAPVPVYPPSRRVPIPSHSTSCHRQHSADCHITSLSVGSEHNNHPWSAASRPARDVFALAARSPCRVTVAVLPCQALISAHELLDFGPFASSFDCPYSSANFTKPPHWLSSRACPC